MDPERAGELLAQERERIERALGGLAHTDTGEEADDIDPGNLASDLYQDELDEGLADGLREQLAALERPRPGLPPEPTASRSRAASRFRTSASRLSRRPSGPPKR